MTVLTTEDALEYLGIDYADAVVRANASRALRSAEQRMRGAVGSDIETVLPNDPRIDDLTLIFMEENYDGLASRSPKEIAVIKETRNTLELQLRSERSRVLTAGGGTA